MPEPLRLDVELGAQGVAAGINEISKANDGLKVSSQKASFAVKAFANDIANAKDASDVASAALGAFTRILGTSVAATVFAAGAKAVYDAYTEITGAVDKAKKSLEEAYEVTSRGGLAENFAEGVAQAKEFDKVADSVNKKIKEINDSPFKNLIDSITGSTEKMRETVVLAEQEAARRREAASAAELQYQLSIQGATEEQKAIKEVEKALSDQLDQINVLKEGKTAENLTAIANIKKEAIERKAATEERQKSEKNLSEVIKERAQSELKAYEAEAKARQDAQKIFQTFEEERAKAHKEELKRSAERIGTIQDEIKTLQERGDALRESLISAGGDIAMLGAAAFGSGRGPGQRMTSGEVGTRRNEQRAKQEATRRAGLEARQEAKERIIKRAEKEGKVPITGGYAINRELDKMAQEAAAQKALSPVEEYKKQQKAIEENKQAVEKLTGELKDAKKAQEDLNSQTEETTATFEGTDYSVNQMGASASIVAESLGSLDGSVGAFSESISSSLKDVDGLGAAAESSNKYLSSLATEASNLAKIFSNFGEMDITTINTDSIVLN
jgi:hypothetical protein